MAGTDVKLSYELPPTIRSIRDGYQMTFQSAAVVSGLLAGAAAQLYSFFKDDKSYSQEAQKKEHVRQFIVICCYSALFFNIGATISGFILIDGLGEMQYHAATNDKLPAGGTIGGSSLVLLKRFGGSGFLSWLIVHWFTSFCLGVVSLLLLLCTYAFVEESTAIKVIAVCLSFYIIIPALGFVYSLHRGARRMDEASHSMGEAGASHSTQELIPSASLPTPTTSSYSTERTQRLPRTSQPNQGQGYQYPG